MLQNKRDREIWLQLSELGIELSVMMNTLVLLRYVERCVENLPVTAPRSFV